jgi:hypothetical protein
MEDWGALTKKWRFKNSSKRTQHQSDVQTAFFFLSLVRLRLYPGMPQQPGKQANPFTFR